MDKYSEYEEKPGVHEAGITEPGKCLSLLTSGDVPPDRSLQPTVIKTEEELVELLSKPSAETVEMFSHLDGDIIFLGIAGKIGPSLARMAKRACDIAGVSKRVIGVSRFSDQRERDEIEGFGIETIQGDLLDREFLESLPQVKNVYFLAGMKFGSEDNLSLTWAMNTYVPALVADYFRKCRIVAFSTGCVYPLVDVHSGGSLETDRPGPVGEYAQSCLGRERMFEYGSRKHMTHVTLIRLNYAVELRYGVLVDIAVKVKNRVPIDLSMGHFNVIWQGDFNDMALRSIQVASSPARILNITGDNTVQVREVAQEFGRLLGINPLFVGTEMPTALLNNPGQSFDMFGKPQTSLDQIIQWTAGWVIANQRLLGKPTHFEVRNGKY
ncbi:MAG: NAD-dependent epimerase/dehydratase family protein [Lentimicrobium sp.]|nr:NAD-dependent epimerase/dehydratase family protein [Lentimicrobium sp.]